MCDTFVALPHHTASGELLFGKNSDREPNEAQAMVHYPARQCQEASVRCTYIEIPQATRVHEVILAKPFQMWGAEMGVNEHGVVIGNEAVFTKIKMPKVNSGLTGMDLVRLALERSSSSAEALDTITELLETHGQNACGGYRNQKFFYHNSFILADRESAWILETAGRQWAARRVADYGAISNGLTIESDYDRISAGAIECARRNGWYRGGHDFNFRVAYSDWLYTRVSNCRRRQQSSSQRLQGAAGSFDRTAAVDILCSHAAPDDQFVPSRSTSASICMHASGVTNPSQTTGAMIVQVGADRRPTLWLTGTSLPCLSVFVPYWLGESAADHPLTAARWNTPDGTPDQSLWWTSERVHRWVCRDYQGRRRAVQRGCQELQREWFRGADELIQKGAPEAERHRFSKLAVTRTQQLWHEWEHRIGGDSAARSGWRYRYFWHRTNRQIGW